jgi:RHS repeat-associated protein
VDLLTGLGTDEHLVRTDSAGSRDLLTDALGTTVSLADSSGAVQTEYSYEPFGLAAASGSSSTNELRYTGREEDGTGLNYYRARYYHPALQRFISEDPIGLDRGDTNFYAYVANNPVSFADPSGLTLESNLIFAFDFLTGHDTPGRWTTGVTNQGRSTRVYGPNSLETREMMRSYGGRAMVRDFARGGCRNIAHGNFETYIAAATTLYDPTNTAWRVGSFDYDVTVQSDGRVLYRMYNKAGMHSLFYHSRFVNDRERPGPMGNIRERFEW